MSRAGLRTAPLPRVHAVTDDAVLARPGWLDQAIPVLERGGPEVALHVRGKATSARTLFELVTALRPAARAAGAALVVNDRVDLALVTAVDGVHLGGGSLPIGHARALLGSEAWIGTSVHDAEAAGAAAREGADYVFMGTIFPTASHPAVAGLGVERLAALAKRAPELPMVGIGGIGPENAAEVVAAGAYGVAAIRGIWDAPDPGSAVRLYLEATRRSAGQ